MSGTHCDTNVPSNPYLSKPGAPQLQLSVVVFVDILGYKQMIREAQALGTQSELLQQLRAALDDSFHHLLDDSDPKFGGLWATKAFTDNIVLGFPIHEDAESELGLVLGGLVRFQMAMTLKGFFIRGAVAIGELYLDSDIVFGEGLLEAFRAESELARDPRIVLTDSARKAAKFHIENYYGSIEDSPHYIQLLTDVDGQIFVHYLSVLLEDSPPQLSFLLPHKQVVEGKLQRHRADPRVWPKYRWCALYHNKFCAVVGAPPDEYAVDQAKLTNSPQLLTLGDL